MSKFPNLNASIFSTMSQMANTHQAINLAQGFPNFPVAIELKNALEQWANKEVHQYLPMNGHPALLDKIATLTLHSYQRKVDAPTEILITAGATEGIFATLQALVHPNEEVLILDPCYDCYDTPILLCNARPIHLDLNDDFTPDWELIGNAINTKTKLIVINNPHNPSGKIWTENDFLALEKLVALHPNLLVLSDEVYEYITFENKHISINQRPKLRHKSVCISSFGKSFHITGWKIGYLVAPEWLMVEIKKIHQFLVFSVNSPAQYAINDYLDVVQVDELRFFYQNKRDYFKSLLQNTQFKTLPCEGSYFQLASYSTISDENDIDFTKRLVKEFGVATIPLSPFYANAKQTQCIRFCFAKDEKTLEKAVERLVKLI